MSEIADILERAADLIEPEGAWTQRAMARDQFGRPVSPHDPHACSFCASGAVMRIIGRRQDRIKFKAFAAAMEEMEVFPPAFNDNHSQAEVVAKLREAAAKARAGQ